MRMAKSRIFGFVFVLLGALILLYHLLISGRFFDLGDIIHHEFFEAIFFTAGLVLILTAKLTKVAAN
jgi:hypothetical protein